MSTYGYDVVQRVQPIGLKGHDMRNMIGQRSAEATGQCGLLDHQQLSGETFYAYTHTKAWVNINKWTNLIFS